MNRRAFLSALGFGTVAAAAAASGVLDIERLLWEPGKKTIFLPTVVPLSETLHMGDIFTIAGRFAVHPTTGRITDTLQAFVVTSTVSSGRILLRDSIAPMPITDGIYRNVSTAVPLDIDARLVTPWRSW